MRPWSRQDWIAVAVLFIVAASAGAGYVRLFDRLNVRTDNFGQSEYAAAVAFGCGRGFVDLGYELTPGLHDFLTVKSDRFSCAELPAAVPEARANFTQGLYRYLMMTVGLVWRIRGEVSWSGLWPLFGFVYGCTVAAAYALFRTAIGRGWSVAAATALLLSTIHLTQLPYLRDYSKAPFIIGSILLLMRLSTRGIAPRRMWTFAAGFGLLLGVGMGFRNDIGIIVPPFLAVVLFARPHAPGRRAVVKAGAIAIAALVFVVIAFPILRSYSRGSNSGHVALLGMMTTFDANLGIRPSPYDWGYLTDDGFAASVITEYGARTMGKAAAFLSAEYDQAAVKYLLLIARNFPADMLARGLGATIKVLNMPFEMSIYSPAHPAGATSAAILKLYEWQSWIIGFFSGRGVLVVVLALVLASVESPLAALGMLLLAIYYAGYPALQFHIRHFFHLEFLAWGAAAFAAEQLWRVGRRVSRGDRRGLWRAGAFTVAAASLVAGSVAIARAYQEPHARRLVRDYLAAPREQLEVVVSPRGQHALVSPGPRAALSGSAAGADYLIAEFSAAGCSAIFLPEVMMRYAPSQLGNIYSRVRDVRLAPGSKPTYVFFASYSMFAHFEGIELPREQAGCVSAFYRITDLSSTPMLLGLMLEPEWEHERFAQTIKSLERDDIDRRTLPRVLVAPRDLVVTRDALGASLAGAPEDAVRQAAFATRSQAGEWTVRGRPDIPTSELIALKESTVPAGATFVAQGELARGGATFALVDGNHRVVASVSVDEAGPFLVSLAAPAAGTYALSVNAHIAPWWPASWIGHRIGPLVGWIPFATLREDLTVRRMGWLASPKG